MFDWTLQRGWQYSVRQALVLQSMWRLAALRLIKVF